MHSHCLHVLCIQETHIAGATSFITEAGFLVILSGGPGEEREYAGVGFIVSPAMRHAVIGFREHTGRMASLKLKVQGGKIGIVSAYAPHGGRDYALRQSFFNELNAFFSKLSAHGSSFIAGNLNARLHYRCAHRLP